MYPSPKMPPARRIKQLFLALLLLVSTTGYSTIPTGYYDGAAGKSGAALKTALYNIIKGHTSVSYAYLWTAFYTTDDKANGKVWDMYSDIPGGTPPYEYTFGNDQCGNAAAEGDCYSREHSFPKSWFGGDVSPMYTDLFHIVPTDQYVNNRRSDYPYAKVGTATWTSMNGSKLGSCATTGYSGVVFEPRDDFKGDFARNYFYMATRYENVIASWQNNNTYGAAVLNGTSFPAFQTWYINMLLEWSAQDPVSQKEIDRNEAVYAIQNNRNPFIDHPEYAAAIWGPSTPPTLTVTPANQAVTSAAGVTTFAITTTLAWTAVSNQTWCVPTASGSGNGTLTASYTANTTFAQRTATITVTASGLTPVTVTVTQAPAAAQLAVTPSNKNVTTAAGFTTYSIVSNTSWVVSSDQTWCIPETSGSGNYTLSVEYAENTTNASRVANITVTVSGLTPVVVTLTQAGVQTLPEPTNFPTNFSGCNIRVHWTDATGTVVPTGYLVRMSTTGFGSITAPVDGTPVADNTFDRNVAAGVQEVWYKSLLPNTTYFFKIYGYTGTGSVIDYKTDGEIPMIQESTYSCSN